MSETALSLILQLFLIHHNHRVNFVCLCLPMPMNVYYSHRNSVDDLVHLHSVFLVRFFSALILLVGCLEGHLALQFPVYTSSQPKVQFSRLGSSSSSSQVMGSMLVDVRHLLHHLLPVASVQC